MADQERTADNPYTTAEFDNEFLRSQRSDPAFIATRLLTLLGVYFILARGVLSGEFGPGLLLIPITAEWLAMMWIGLILARTTVDCPAFRATGDRPVLVVFWSLLVFAVISVRFAYTGDGLDLARVAPGWEWLGRRLIETGLIWAIVLEVGGLLVATLPEVRRWKRAGGVFVWTAITGLGLRLAAMLLIAFFATIVLAFLSEVYDPLANRTRVTWLVFILLLLVEFGGFALGVFVHRDLKAGGSTSGRPRERGAARKGR